MLPSRWLSLEIMRGHVDYVHADETTTNLLLPSFDFVAALNRRVIACGVILVAARGLC